MDNNQSVNIGCGGSLFTLLAALFIGLKLAGVIEWAWVWVLSPLWGSCALGLIFVVIIVALAYWAES